MNSLTRIFKIKARMIFNSRGEPTLEATIFTKGGYGRASSPSGVSKGKFEVKSYPNNNVLEAVKQVEKLVAPALIGLDADEQKLVDQTLHKVDGTIDFSKVGGNTAYAISLAAADAAANALNIPMARHLSGSLANDLPQPLGNVLGGGKHAGKNAPDIQEFLVLPMDAPSFLEAAKTNIEIHKKIGKILEKEDASFSGGKGDEGAWAPNINNEDALRIVAEASSTVSDESGIKVGLGLDIASSSLWDPQQKKYVYKREGRKLAEGEQIDFILNLVRKYRLTYVEDPLHEEDFQGFAELTKKAKNCLICGDDLFVTNIDRLRQGLQSRAGNAIIIKPNQVGTLTHAFETTKLAKGSGYIPIVSHRSGETVDSHLAHVAVAFGSPIIKLGVMGGERTAKVNELIRLEAILGKRARIHNLKEII